MKIARSLKTQIIVAIILILFPYIALINFYNYNSLSLLIDDSISQQKTQSSYYINSLDKELNGIVNYISLMIVTDSNIAKLTSKDETTRFKSASFLHDTLKKDVTRYQTVNYMFIHSLPFDQFLSLAANNLSSQSTLSVESFFKSYPFSDTPSSSYWKMTDIEGSPYLIYVYSNSSLNMGCAISVQNLMNEFQSDFLSAYDGKVIATTVDTGLSEKYLREKENIYYSVSSSVCDLNMQVSIPAATFQNQFLPRRQITLLFVIVGVIMLILFYLLLRYQLFLPLGSVEKTMEHIRNGNLTDHITAQYHTNEFNSLKNTFNHMIDDISSLNQKVQNEIIKSQEAELNYLRMQIRPHFFLNALTTISNFATIGKLNEMYEFTDHLSKHIRFMFRNNLKKITIGEEISHINNYLNLQKLRFGDNLFSIVECSSDLYHYLIPPLTLYTFVENSIKHTVSMDTATDIYIRILRKDTSLHMVIEDTGDGFTPDFLQKYGQGLPEAPTDGHHIGIYNIKKTLSILYGEAAVIEFNNSTPHGAVVFISLPLDNTQED